MDGRAFLDIAEELAAGNTEAHWRAAVGRAYYALMLEGWAALLRWSFINPPRDNLHTFVRLRFSFAADPDPKDICDVLEELGRLRNRADYQLANPGPFISSAPATLAIKDARDALIVLDSI